MTSTLDSRSTLDLNSSSNLTTSHASVIDSSSSRSVFRATIEGQGYEIGCDVEEKSFLNARILATQYFPLFAGDTNLITSDKQLEDFIQHMAFLRRCFSHDKAVEALVLFSAPFSNVVVFASLAISSLSLAS